MMILVIFKIMVLRLVFVRHGLSSFNEKGLIQGRTNESKLTKVGYEQAKSAGEVLNSLNFNEIYSSPLLRAAETAKTIEKSLKNDFEIKYDKNLLEVDLEQWTGLTITDIKKNYRDSYSIWKTNPEKLFLRKKDQTIYHPIQELFSQAERFIDHIQKHHLNNENQNILIIAHNAILRCLILNLINRPHKGFRKLRLDNASISILNISNFNNSIKTQIECINQTSHLNQNIPPKIGDSRIILVRHGETDWNKEGRFQGQIDIPLNTKGRDQARKASEYLKDLDFKKAYSSSMQRPFETAKIILDKNKIKIQKIRELIEISHGLWEGKLEEEIKIKWPKTLESWHSKPEDVTMPEGESIKQVSERSILAWEVICKSQNVDDITLLVAHDAVNKTLICNILGLSFSNIWMIKQGNGGITVIDIFNDPEKDNVISALNITNHLGEIIDITASGAL
tara:strand:+ start:7348 stop:8700 length:1353 start_codon:yes stop_codon:yes gene_type:complete